MNLILFFGGSLGIAFLLFLLIVYKYSQGEIKYIKREERRMPDKKLWEEHQYDLGKKPYNYQCEDCHHVIEVMASKPTEYAGNCECGGKLRIKTTNGAV